MKTYVGIDFGACNIKAAQISGRNKKMTHIKLNKKSGGGAEAPNIILYDKVGDKVEIKVGKPAKNSPAFENKVQQIKTKLSLRDWKKYIASLGRDVTAAEVVKDTLQRIWETITVKTSAETEWDAVITVPVSFSEAQKKVMRKAATDAGIPVSAMVTEPFAAMFSLGDTLENADEEMFLIFDFGGSTLDMSLFRIERDDDELNVTELAASGLNYGGINIDEGILEDVLRVKFRNEIDEFLAGDPDGRLKIDLMSAIADMKEALFIERDADEETESHLSGATGNLYKLSLTKDDVIAVLKNAKLKEKISARLDEMFDDADVDKSEVTGVKLFGGTASITYIWEIITDYFGADIFDCEDFDIESEDIFMGISVGAVNYLALSNDEQSNVTIKNVIPYSLGLARDGKFRRYIKRNELAGFELPYKPLLIEDLKKNGWHVSVYQSFSNELELELNGEDAVFMADVSLDEHLYTVDDAVLFKMKMTEDGKLNMKFFEQRLENGEPEIVLVEEKTIEVGE